MIKKLSILLMSVLALGLASCEENWTEATPQSNPQEPLMSLDGLTVGFGSDLSGAALDLNAAADSINVINTTATPKDLVDGQTVEYVMYAASKADFSDATTIDVTTVSGVGKIARASLNTAYRSFFGKTPKANDMYFRFAAYLNYGNNSRVRFGTMDAYFAETNAVSVTPIPENFRVEDAYYIVGGMNEWNMDQLIQFNHSNMDVYDDPVFTLNVQVPDNCYWKIVPQSAKDLDNPWQGEIWGTAIDGDDSESGTLVKDNPQAGRIVTGGWVRITINMMDNTYSVKSLGDPYLYMIGTPNEWNISNGDYVLTSADYDDVYSGIYSVPSSCYFRFYEGLGDWDTGSHGAAVNDGDNVDVAFTEGVYNGTAFAGKGCWVIADAGSYFFRVDLNNNTLFLNKIDEAALYVMGNCNGWDVASTACKLTNTMINGTGHIYTGEVEMPDSGEGKSYFRFNTALSWASQIGSLSGVNEEISLSNGVASSSLKFGSEGCYVVPAGTYVLTVDLDAGEVSFQKN